MRLFGCLIAWMLVVPAFAARAAAAEDDMMAALMDWAVSLSGYPGPDTLPTVDFVSQEFFDAHACGGKGPFDVSAIAPRSTNDAPIQHSGQ